MRSLRMCPGSRGTGITRAGVWEPVVMLPAILGSRFAYAAGMAVGGVQWLRRRGRGGPSYRPRWQ